MELSPSPTAVPEAVNPVPAAAAVRTIAPSPSPAVATTSARASVFALMFEISASLMSLISWSGATAWEISAPSTVTENLAAAGLAEAIVTLST